MKLYGDSANVKLNMQHSGYALSMQREGVWMGYIPLVGGDTAGSVPFSRMQLTYTDGVYELHFYNADGTWLCKK